MKIEGKIEGKLLKEISLGDCFYYNGELYMRIKDNREYVFNGSVFKLSGISFATNRIVKFEEDALVQPVNAKIVIE